MTECRGPQQRNVFIFLRAFFEDPKDFAPAVELLEKTRIYPAY
jgi:hypothetical protein